MDLYGKEESFSPSFAERRAAMHRQRHREQAMAAVTALLSLMVGVLSLKMYGMSAAIEELSAASLSLSAPPPRTRPDYVGTAKAFVGGYTLYGHVLTDEGELSSFNVAQECICECNGTRSLPPSLSLSLPLSRSLCLCLSRSVSVSLSLCLALSHPHPLPLPATLSYTHTHTHKLTRLSLSLSLYLSL